MILITESKRDDLLIPYYNLVKDIYPGLSLGEFKKMMLKKLAAQGSINNLSLSSNYYLAGATKYYFQGALTTDGQKQIMSGDPDKPDNWNIDICKRLNALVEILRNAYIDSVGTAFEQPEDFGELPLNKLLKKYGKKIDEVLGIATKKEKEEPQDTLDRSPRVGNGYTFDILYSYEDATKYNQYTTPGAWCITYGKNHYDYYIRTLAIHYVIFRKDGFESVPREHDENFTSRKPHDAYGNSLIAFLQSNANPNGVFITSRWNHGYGESIEADHAYTMDEFMNITGVSAEDLRRIYLIWLNDSKKYGEGAYSKKNLEAKKEQKIAYGNILRKFKYAQMVVSGGENPQKALELAGLEWVRTQGIVGDYREPRKATVVYEVRDGDLESRILVDRNKFLFETIPFPGKEDDTVIESVHDAIAAPEGVLDGLVVIGCDDNYMLYNSRFHEYVNIGGVTKFKRLPKPTYMRTNTPTKYIEIKNGMKDIALLSVATCRPVKLPNGEYWFNSVYWSNNHRWERGGQIICHALTVGMGPVIEIVYDDSSREKYFLDINSGKFLDWIKHLEDPTGEGDEPILFDNGITGFRNYVSIAFRARGSESRWGRYVINSARVYTLDGEMVSIYGRSDLGEAKGCSGRFIVFEKKIDIQSGRGGYYYYHSAPKYVYDCVTKKLIAAGDEPLEVKDSPFFTDTYSDSGVEGSRVAYIKLHGKNDDYYAVYDLESGLLLKDTLGSKTNSMPSYAFRLYDSGKQDGLYVWIDDFNSWAFFMKISDWDKEKIAKRYGVKDAWEARTKEEKKHYKVFAFDSFEKIPNNLPINNEHEAQQPTVAPTLAEAEIKEMVRKSIREAIEKI